ncbi:MAG: hypothetical protein Kow0067_01800 [Coriobacteriia bacterium]
MAIGRGDEVTGVLRVFEHGDHHRLDDTRLMEAADIPLRHRRRVKLGQRFSATSEPAFFERTAEAGMSIGVLGQVLLEQADREQVTMRVYDVPPGRRSCRRKWAGIAH